MVLADTRQCGTTCDSRVIVAHFFPTSFASCRNRHSFRDSDVDAAAELTPALLVLNKMVLASEESRMAVKRAIFPPEADKVGDDE